MSSWHCKLSTVNSFLSERTTTTFFFIENTYLINLDMLQLTFQIEHSNFVHNLQICQVKVTFVRYSNLLFTKFSG